jgi:glucan phosphoethanolaminetransferase (alkaline phosphatase superfamily)
MEDYMLPCLNKKLFGIECLGCGIQRATALLFEGEFVAAFKIYPAIYTLILLVLFLVFNLTIKFKFDRSIKISLIVLNILIIVISYAIKMSKHL